MESILRGEWRKLRRCQIMLVGIVAVALCPVVQYGTQWLLNPEVRDPAFTFEKTVCQCDLGKHTDLFSDFSCDDRRMAE